MTDKTIFLTGAAGFIGSNTAEALLKAGHHVVGFDNLNPVYDPRKKRHNIKLLEKLSARGRFEFIEGDLRDSDGLSRAMGLKNYDAVIHLAALAGVQPSIQDPETYAETNITGTLHLFEAAVQNKIRPIVFASSSSVYGGNQKLPFSESDPVNHPISPYAATKRSGELLAYTYAYLHQLSIACLRFFTVYGPRQRPDLAIYKFTRAMLKGEPITLYGDGTSSRDYTFIDDCVDGILKAMNWTLQEDSHQPRYDIFNLGESQTVQLSELIEILEKNLGMKAKRTHADYLPGDVYATFADLNHAKEVLGYQPKVKIEEGIRRFCQWYLKEEKDAPWSQ